MYLDFFNLIKEPFNITPDPEMLFLSHTHKEALAAVIYGVEKRKGFISIVGEVGLGKTTILRSFLDRIEKEKLKTIYIFNPNLSFQGLLESIFHNLGEKPRGSSVNEMVDRLHEILISEYRSGRNLVLIIDEAQNMPLDTLENLRMLSNLETSNDKLIQIVFSGQPEFETKLKEQSLRQLRQRIAIRVKLHPLSTSDSMAYMRHRISISQRGRGELFSRQAIRRIVATAEGIPRLINIISDNCLITSFGRNERQVTDQVVKEIVADLGFEELPRRGWRLATLFMLLSLFLAIWGYFNRSMFMAGASSVGIDHRPEQQPTAPAAVPLPSDPPESVEKSPKMTEPPEATEPECVRKRVRKGDTLAKLIMETYGMADQRILRIVKEKNPHILDENRIVEGDTIIFPVENKKP